METETLLQALLGAAMLLGAGGVVQGLRLVQRINAADEMVVQTRAVIREVTHIGWFSSSVVLSLPLEETALRVPCKLPHGRLSRRHVRVTDMVTALWRRGAMEAVAAQTIRCGQVLLIAGFAVMICTVLAYGMLF